MKRFAVTVVLLIMGCSSGLSTNNAKREWPSESRWDREENLNQRRAGMILKLEALLRENPLYSNKGDVLFRLAIAYCERAEYWAKFAHRDPDYGIAIAYYWQLISRFPNYPKLELAKKYLQVLLLAESQPSQGSACGLLEIKDYKSSRWPIKIEDY